MKGEGDTVRRRGGYDGEGGDKRPRRLSMKNRRIKSPENVPLN
jgi:hypothetical protein